MNPKPAVLSLLISSSIMAAEVDIIEQAIAHPRQESVRQPDGTFKESKYGDKKLAEAEAFLSPLHPRPWTVTHAIEWFRKADDRSRIHILRLLAASRDQRAALVLGAALESNVRLAAGEGLIDYFLPTAVRGGTEQQIKAAREWFASNKARLESEALTKGSPSNRFEETGSNATASDSAEQHRTLSDAGYNLGYSKPIFDHRNLRKPLKINHLRTWQAR